MTQGRCGVIVQSVLKVVLVDVNPDVVRAWRSAFSDLPEVKVVQGSILQQHTDAWVTPTNSRGSMDGGVDAVIKRHLGAAIEKAVQKEIKSQYGGSMPIGSAVCVPTGAAVPRYLISTPTMEASAEDVSDTMNVALACAAAFQMIHLQNAREPGSIASVALPGLGVGTGQVPVRVCANLMWSGYTLFTDHQYEDFGDMQGAVREQVGEIPTWTEEVRVRFRPK
jgi:O-acetyl-ADP-ribose deacetylase (regulator of RNase III)